MDYKITSVEPQQKGSFFNVKINGEYMFSADEKFLTEFYIEVGRIISENELNELIAEATNRKTLSYAYKLLEYRDYTHDELIKKLMEKGCEEEPSEYAADKLQSLGYINDRRRAESVFERYKTRYGRDRIEVEMRKRGISKELTEEILEEFYDDSSLGEESAEREINRKLKGKTLDDRREILKLFNSLRAKGFEFDTIKKAYENYENNKENY